MSDSALHFVPGANASPSEAALFDIIFVHGLDGHYKTSWQHANGAYWPEWIAADCPSANVYAAAYSAKAWATLAKGNGADLVDLGSILLDLVVAKCGTKRPLIFITHSLGGLVVKQLIRKADGASNPYKRSVRDRVRGIAFVATPHQGADVAKAVQTLASKVVKELAPGDALLLDLGEWFSNWVPNQDLQVCSYYELQKYNGVIVVDKRSANPNVQGCDPTAVEADHVSITKLSDKESHLYISIRAMIAGLLASSKPAAPSETLECGDDLLSEYEALTTSAPADRMTLAEKLTSASRKNEIRRAETLKERYSMSLHRHAVHRSAVMRQTQIMSQVESRFNLHVKPAIASGLSIDAINKLIQSEVVDPVIGSVPSADEPVTYGTVESIIYYLAGNCHIRWDDA